ncbi:unnamed protein product, partial [marine sediment metagenome]
LELTIKANNIIKNELNKTAVMMRVITIVIIISKIFNEFLMIKSCSNFKKILSINGGILIKIKSRYKRELLRIK